MKLYLMVLYMSNVMIPYFMVYIVEFYEYSMMVPYLLVHLVKLKGKMVLYESNKMMLYVYGKLMNFCKKLFSHRVFDGSSTRGIVMLVLLNLPSIQAVCPTCKGAVDGCAGGAACPWLTTVAANAAAVLVTATAGFISAKALLPPGLLQAFPRSVLDTILLLARMPAAGTPFNMTSTTMAAELRMAYRQGRISKSDVAEGISNLIMNAGSTNEELTKLQMQIKALELELSEAEPQSRTELGGVYVYILAKISQFVLKTNAPVWARAAQERAGTSMAASLHFPPVEIADAAVPMMTQLFVLFVHAFGLEHLHTVGPFVQKVVHESVWLNDFTWQFAFELLLVYLKALDERRQSLTMATIWESGSQDTYTKMAHKAAAQRWGSKFVFFRAHGGNPGTNNAAAASSAAAAAASSKENAKIKWNGKFTSGAKPCLTFNNGRSQLPSSRRHVQVRPRLRPLPHGGWQVWVFGSRPQCLQQPCQAVSPAVRGSPPQTPLKSLIG